MWLLRVLAHVSGPARTHAGGYGFSSFSIHLAFVILFSSLWGVVFREWQGGRHTRWLLLMGLAILLSSTLISGYGNYLKAFESQGWATAMADR